MVSIQEHINFLREFRYPMKKELALYFKHLYTKHLQADRLHEENGEVKMTFDEFLDEILRKPQSAKPYVPSLLSKDAQGQEP